MSRDRVLRLAVRTFSLELFEVAASCGVAANLQ